MPAYDDEHFATAAPVARVILSNPVSGVSIADVRMLIDSGSDVTLLPESAVASLGLEATGERYRLEAFDGTTTEAEAVHAVLGFLGKTFRGRFLPVKSEVGVRSAATNEPCPVAAGWPGPDLGRGATDGREGLTKVQGGRRQTNQGPNLPLEVKPSSGSVWVRPSIFGSGLVATTTRTGPVASAWLEPDGSGLGEVIDSKTG